MTSETPLSTFPAQPNCCRHALLSRDHIFGRHYPKKARGTQKPIPRWPTYLHDAESGRGNGIREVTTGWGDGTDDGDGALALLWPSEATHAACTLVEAACTEARQRGMEVVTERRLFRQ